MFPKIREASPGDAAEIARLLTDLGHPTTAESVAARWNDWVTAGNTAIVSGFENGDLAGVATLHQMTVLHRPAPVGRITALIVDAPMQGRGIGRALVAAAEAFLQLAGCGLLEITSNDRLVEAHRFYERLGYQRTSIRLAKVFEPLAVPIERG